MMPFEYQVNPNFSPGVESLGFISLFSNPDYAIQGPGNFCGRLRIFEPQMVQMQAVPQAWSGIMTGQLVLQPLTQADGIPQT